METLDLKIAAATAGILDGFEPQSWLALDDPRGHRVLVSDGERSVVAVLVPSAGAEGADAEEYAAALLRGLLPGTSVTFPQILGRLAVPAEQFDSRGEEIRVCAPLPGTPASTVAFADSPALVTALAEFLAELHNADPGDIADSGLAVLDSAEERQRLLDALDAGAATGQVPSVLLSRWETALENVATWRFFPCAVHGGLSEDALRTEGGRIAAVTDLGRLHIGDPATDLAAVTALLHPDAVEEFFTVYRGHRAGPDPGLRTRVELRSELTALDWLLEARRGGDDGEIADAVALLASLAELTDAPAEGHPGPYGGTGPEDAQGAAPAAPPGEQSAEAITEPGAAAEQPADATGPEPKPVPGPEPLSGTGADTGADPAATTSPPAPRRTAVRAGDVFRPTAPVTHDIDEESASAVPTERITGPEDR
ncbi:phosphotransferase [Brevibacterium sp. NPDC049920]|uniref:Aminoglycoside phosphotransferase domain-containing protein n=1 Tax=Brevibacterium pityocampae TaxID=506594 RepID=A0ABP8JIJ7_9MICO|nr:phosphotransferase [uncultured Brevibacterium sp.]